MYGIQPLTLSHGNVHANKMNNTCPEKSELKYNFFLQKYTLLKKGKDIQFHWTSKYYQ